MSEEDEEDIPFLERIFFKKYKPIKLIGKGGFGTVYSCINILEQKEYAMKVVRNKYNIYDINFRKKKIQKKMDY